MDNSAQRSTDAVASPPKIRGKKLFWRIFEAFVILAGLLVAHQTIWLLFERYLINQSSAFITGQARAPDLTVYVKPDDPGVTKLNPQHESVVGEYSTRNPDLNMIGLAQSRSFVIPVLNGIDQNEVSTSGGRFSFRLGPLRRGLNVIAARVREEIAEDREGARAPPQFCSYHPPVLPPRFISVMPEPNGQYLVRGVGEPESVVWVKHTRAGATPAEYFEKVVTNGIGAFDCFAEPTTTELLVAVTQEDLATAPADKITISSATDGPIKVEPQRLFPRKMLISFPGDNHYEISLSMKLPPDAAVYEWVENKQVTAAELAGRVFGLECRHYQNCEFWTNTKVLPTVTDDGIQLTVAGEMNSGAFTFSLTNGDLGVLGLPGDEIKAKIGNTRRVIAGADWVQQQDQTLLWTRRSPAYDFLQVSRLTTVADNVAPPSLPRLENLGDFLKALERKLPDSLGQILQALLAAIPYLFVLWFLRERRSGYESTLFAVTASLLLFHLTILSLPVFSSSLSVVRDLLGLVPGEEIIVRGQTVKRGLIDQSLTDVGRIYPVLAIGISLLLLPIYVSYKHRPPTFRGRRRVLWRFLVRPFLWASIVVLPLTLFGFYVYAGLRTPAQYRFAGQPEQMSDERWLIMAGIAALVSAVLLPFFLYCLMRISLGRAIKPMAVIKASWAMILLPLLPLVIGALALTSRYLIITRLEIYPFFIPRNLDRLLWLVTIPMLGTIVLFHVTYFTVRLCASSKPMRWFRRRRAKRLLIALFILSCLPMGYLLNLRPTLGINDLTELAFNIDGLLPSVVLLGLLVYLRKLTIERDNYGPQQVGDFDLPKQARRIGVLLFAFYLTGRTANLLFVPIPFLLGWFLFSKWVLTKPQGLQVADVGKLVRKILDYKQALHLTYAVRKTAEKNYSEDKIKLEDLKTRIKEADKNLEEAKSNLSSELSENPKPEVEVAAASELGAGEKELAGLIESLNAADRHPMEARLNQSPKKLSKESLEAESRGAVFGHGPEDGPWANARLAVRYGLIISIPFQASTLSKIFAGKTFGDFPILSVLRDILFTATFWVLAAFLFGYFFHLIRGRDGFRKALVYSVGIIVPTIPLRLIQAEPLLGQGYVIQMVQIFAYMLVLALVAFDLRTLINLGYTWRDLISVHGFTTISGYVSTIILSVVSSISGKNILGGLWGYVKDAFKV